MTKAGCVLFLLLASCGWKSPHDFAEKEAVVDASTSDVTTPVPDSGQAADTATTDIGGGADQSTPVDAGGDVASFVPTTSGSAMGAASATTDAVPASDSVLLWVVSFSQMTPNAPSVPGFTVEDRQTAGNRRQLVLMHGSTAAGPLQIDFGGQTQETILWAVVSTNLTEVVETGSFQSSGSAASVPVAAASDPSRGAVAGFIVGGSVTAAPDPGFNDTGGACGGGACLVTVAGPGPTNAIGVSWTGDAPWIGAAAVLSP